MRARLSALSVMFTCVVVTSCGPAPSARDLDCNARVRLHGDTFRPAVGLHTPYRGEPVGMAAYVGCEGDTPLGLDDVEAFTARGQDPSLVVVIAEENGDAAYISDTLPWRDRPRLVRNSEHYLRCSRPARFTGTWLYVEPEDMPDSEDYDSARVPYTGTFSVRQGTGVRLDRWAQVTLRAEIGEDTDPVPSARFLERATRGGLPVAVTATCRDKAFQVETIRFAR